MKKTVKIIFTQDVVGHLAGDKAEISLGYARNFLFPKKLAVSIDDPQAQEIIKKLKEEGTKKQKEIDQLSKLAKEYNEKEVVIKAKAGTGKKLFGSITSKDVAKALKLENVKLNMKPIKELGQHLVELNFGHNIKSKIKVIVKDQQEDIKK